MYTQTHHHWFDVEQVQDVTIVKLTCPTILNNHDVETVSQQLLRLPAEGHCKIVLNLAAVKRMTSNMVAKLVAFQREVWAIDGELVLCRLQPGIVELFTILQLLPQFKVADTELEALESLYSA
jgi:anti-anti-sigma factor